MADSNIVDLFERRVLKDSEVKFFTEFAEKVSVFFELHNDIELENIGQEYYRKLNGKSEQNWLDKIPCYVGVPTGIKTEEQIIEENLFCLNIPFGVIVKLSKITGINYKISFVFDVDRGTEGTMNMLVHTSVQDFFIELDVLTYERLSNNDPFSIWDSNDDTEALTEKKIIVSRINHNKMESLKVRMLHQVLQLCLDFADRDEKLFEMDIFKKTFKNESSKQIDELIQTYKAPDLELVYGMYISMEDPLQHFRSKENFKDFLIEEFKTWSSDLWEGKDENTKRRKEYLEAALKNSSILPKDA